MRQSSKIITLAALLLLVFTLGASTADTEQSEVALPLPLWEPDWSPVGVSAYDRPVAADSADIDGDGSQDVILLGLRNVYTFEGDDKGFRYFNLGSRFRDYDQPLSGNALACGDVNGDGLDDLVVGTRGYDIWIFLQQPEAGGFEATTDEPIDFAEEFNHLWLFDHTGDGILDLMIPDRAGKNGWLTVYAGDGDGGFGAPRSVEGIGEITRDGEVDASSSEPGLWILTHDGAWFLPQGSLIAEERITRGGKGIAVADFNGDGPTDVAIAGTTFRVYLRQGDDYVMDLRPLDSMAYWVDHGDVDGDGDEDLVAWSYGPLRITTLNNQDGEFVNSGVYAVAYTELQETLTGGNCVDIDGDGTDEVLSHSAYGRVGVLTSIPGGSSPQLAPGPFLLGEMDMNGDGIPDVLTSTYEGGIAYLRDTSTSLYEAVDVALDGMTAEFPEAWTPTLVVPGDLDGNGEDEMILWAANEYGGSFLSGWSEYQDVWQPAWIAGLQGALAPRLLATDLDGDGKDELIIGDGMHFSVRELTDGELVQTDRIPWGDDVGPYTAATLPHGEHVVGFRDTYESSDLLWLDEDGAHETGIALELSALDIVAEDIDDDGVEELIFVGLGVDVVGDRIYLRVKLGVASALSDGTWRVDGPWTLEGWPAESIPYPYGGLCIVSPAQGQTTFAISYAPGRHSNGGMALVSLPDQEDAANLNVSYIATATGPTIFVREHEGHPILLSTTSTSPQVLRVVEVE